MEYNTTRGYVVEKAVNIEAAVSRYLALLLGINASESISFGDTTTALSFSSKINLLRDLDVISSEIKADLLLFLEIRNKFAHVADVVNFTSCFEHMNTGGNKQKKLRELVEFDNNTDSISDEESRLAYCFSALCLKLGSYLQLLLNNIESIKKDTFSQKIILDK